MSQSPFESPRQLPSGYFGDVPLGQPMVAYNRGMIGHVPIVGGLLIAQAVLEAAFFGIMAMTSIVMSQAALPPNMPKENLAFTIGAMVVFATAALIGAFSHFIAGILMLTFRRRTATIVCLCVGFVSIFTVYCSVTMLPIAIYALIVLVNEPVIWAYSEIDKGTPRDQVLLGQPFATPVAWSRPAP